MQGRGALALARLRISLSTSQAHLGWPQSPSSFFLARMEGSSLRAPWQFLVSDVHQTVDKATALFRALRYTDDFVGEDFRFVLHDATDPGATSSFIPSIRGWGERAQRKVNGEGRRKLFLLLLCSLRPGFLRPLESVVVPGTAIMWGSD